MGFLGDGGVARARGMATCGGLALAALGVGCSASSTGARGVDGGAGQDAAAAHDAQDSSIPLRHDTGAHDAGADVPGPPDSAVDALPTGVDAADGAAGPADGSLDGPITPFHNPVLELGACVGTSMPVTLSGQMPYADVPIGAEAGEFVLDFGSTFSSIDLSAFDPPGPKTSGCDASELGVTCTVEGFAFFAPPGDVELTTESYADVTGSVRQAGILGTDFLSEHVITLDYAGGNVYAASASAFCSASVLGAAGYAPLSVAGFYENDLSLLEPFSDVDSAATGGDSVPDVPTVPVQVAGAAAVAQLDTGFDDDVTPFSVNINQAFYAAIVAAKPGALVAEPSKNDTLTTCVDGVSESLTAYRLASGVTFGFGGASGAPVRSYGQATLFVKDTPASAASCGGIGTWTVPAAQVGASFYVEMKSLLFDPFGATVWVPKQ